MTETLKTRGSVNTILIAIADALLAAVMIPLAIYLVKSMIEVKTEFAQMKAGFFTREQLIQKGELMREEAIEFRTELAKLRAEVAILSNRFKDAEENNHKK